MRDSAAVVVHSGGLDSTVLACTVLQTRPVHLLGFDYGQRHRKREMQAAEEIARWLGTPRYVVDMRGVAACLPSTLTDAARSVPEGHYEHESMKQTVVPHRNLLMLTIASAYAMSVGAEDVFFGAHGGDHAIYPDCREEFVVSAQRALNASHGGPSPFLRAPFLHMTKADIVAAGARVRAPMELTWSCYNGRTRHCGKCGPCVERKEAFARAGVPDPTKYEEV